MVLLLLASALAADPAISGSWVLADDASTVQQKQQEALQAAVADMAWAYRPFARPRLEPVVRNCDAIWLDVAPSTFQARCDDNDPFEVGRDGPQAWTNDEGETFTVEVGAAGEALTLSFAGENGGQRTLYARDGAHLLLTKEITSPYLPTPVRWTVRYALKPGGGGGSTQPAASE